MDSVLGLFGMLVYMTAVVGLAAGITYVVVKLSPSKSVKEIEEQNAAQTAAD